MLEEARKKDSFLRKSTLSEFVDWLEVVDTCCLEDMMPFCTAELIVRWEVGTILLLCITGPDFSGS